MQYGYALQCWEGFCDKERWLKELRYCMVVSRQQCKQFVLMLRAKKTQGEDNSTLNEGLIVQMADGTTSEFRPYKKGYTTMILKMMFHMSLFTY